MKNLLSKLLNLIFKDGSVSYINGKILLPPPLSNEEEILQVSLFREGSIEARNILIEHNLRLVVYVAKRFENDIYNLEDLISIGTLGLIKGINTYKTDKNIKLATYASRCIENEILMYLRKKQRQKTEVSLDEPLNKDYDGNELLLSDVISDEPTHLIDEINFEEDKKSLQECLQELKPREKEILEMRFGLNDNEELTQKEVADFLGISQSYISRLEKKILQKLKIGLTK
ncbi:MAG: RNA polymerase sporulation sigma factor SigK [Bacilli bacterium]|nr:RNA polymerase sporulation sigma factor SigK [Bacilli bacterium]